MAPNSDLMPNRQHVVDQVDTVMAWVRQHADVVTWFGLNVHDGSLVVHLHAFDGSQQLAELAELVPWESNVEGARPPAGSLLAAPSATGKAFGGIAVTLLTWWPDEHLIASADADPIDTAVTLHVAGNRL
jgi:hypothetical protein